MATSDMSLLGTFQKHVEDMRALSRCKICFKPFYEPFVLVCGHTYCYSCLSSWFGSPQNRRKQKNCPDCRAIVSSMPSPNYLLRDLVHMFISRAELLPEDETVEEHERGKTEESRSLQADKTGPGLFRGVFAMPFGHVQRHPDFHPVAGHRTLPAPIRDLEDNVERCPGCAWELEEGQCLHCGWNENSEESEEESDWPDEVGDAASVTTDQTVESDFQARMEQLRRLNDQHDHGLHHFDNGTGHDGMSGPDFEDDYDEEDDTDMDGFIDDDDDEEVDDDEEEVDGPGMGWNPAAAHDYEDAYGIGHTYAEHFHHQAPPVLPPLDQEPNPDWLRQMDEDEEGRSPTTYTVTDTNTDAELDDSEDESLDDHTDQGTNYDQSDDEDDTQEIATMPSYPPRVRPGGRAARVILEDSEEDENSDDTTVPVSSTTQRAQDFGEHRDRQQSYETISSSSSVAPQRPPSNPQRWQPYPQRDRSASPSRTNSNDTRSYSWQAAPAPRGGLHYRGRPTGIQNARSGGRFGSTRVY